MWERPEKAVLNAKEELLSTCSPAEEPGNLEKAVFTTVEVLCGSFKPVHLRERPDKAVLTAKKVI